jgi:tetratricopeptide (TPR) repeat protein
VQIEPGDPHVRVSFGEALVSQGRLREALAQLDAALLINPQAARALVLKGLVLAGLGRVDEAIEQYGNALRVDRGNAEAHYNLGVARLRQRWRDRAIEHFEQALRLQPDLSDAHYNLGIALAQEGDFARASVHLERAVEITPDDASVYLPLAMSYVSVDRFDEAIATLRRGLRVAPDHAGLIDRTAWLLATCPDDRLRDGREARRLALDVCRDGECRNPQYLDTLAAAYAETGQFDKAAQTMENAIEQALAFGDDGSVNQLRGRLDLYRSGQSYRLKRRGHSPAPHGRGQ